LPVKKKKLSVLKRQRQSVRKAVYRGDVRSSTRTFVRKARTLVAGGKLAQAPEAIQEAISALDKAAAKGVIHKNNAARRKSRLMAAYHRATQSAAASA
jgi:small subunit ribosomal protein S20